ncbi:MAG: NfeD family protein [Proteobacteria bacterium]|nr:NfeD family protein [Pseudomonadota bacterium]
MAVAPDWLRPELVWFLFGLAMLLLEFAVPGLIIFFFGLGAWLVALICFFGDLSLNAQLILFLVSSVLLLALLRKKLRSLFYGPRAGFKNIEDPADEYVGRKVTVVSEIRPNVNGRVEFHGTDWEAAAEETIPVGTIVEILAKDNITFRVKPLK